MRRGMTGGSGAVGDSGMAGAEVQGSGYQALL